MKEGGDTNFSNMRECYPYSKYLCVALTLLFGLLVIFWHHDWMKNTTNAPGITSELDAEFYAPNDSPLDHDGLLGVKEPLESCPDDPHFCVLVSTYEPHGNKLVTMLTSLFVSEYPYMKAILLDTDSEIDSTPWMKDTAKIVNEIFEKEYVVTANATQRDVLEKYTNNQTGVTDDYGYILTDEVIQQILKERKIARELGTKPECDYFMATNGDNLYSPDMIPALLYYFRQDYDIVSFDFTSRYASAPGDANNQQRVFKPNREDQQLYTQFLIEYIDKGACCFKADTLKSNDMSFAFRWFSPTPKSAVTWDGEFYHDFASLTGIKSHIIDRVCMFHQ